ncbi:MAG TPA: SDR family oxidoreductase, partial [Kribbella sp.]|nr:SDR family oxidoreductase [Kribbella sp.]
MTPESSDRPVALITGASAGLGLALAHGLAERGWALVINARGAEALKDAADALARHTDVVPLAGDVTDPEHRADLVDAVTELGRLDLLVNNASYLGPSPL